MKLAGTGHRPQKFVTHNLTWEAVCCDMWQLAYSALCELPPDTIVISGMALGWDMELADAAQYLRMPVHAYVPFEGQDSKWPPLSQKRYHEVLGKCAEVKIICPAGYAPWKMQRRNEAMVDDCDVLLALHDGSSGGTGNCIDYAKHEGCLIVNLFPYWESGKSASKAVLQATTPTTV